MTHFHSDWTPEQREAVATKFERNPDGDTDLIEFAKRFKNYGQYIGGEWCGMFLGIEKDGYAHT